MSDLNLPHVPGRDDPAAVWDRLSHRYDRQLWLERRSVASAVTLLDPGADERCLDAGTGTGEVLRQLMARPQPPREVTGVDASPGMLSHVGELPAGWSVRHGDLRRLPVPDASVDAVTASYVLHLLAPEDLPVALAELHRVLVPGGRLVSVTPAVPPRGLARPLARALDRLSHRRPDAYRGLRALDPRAELTRAGFRLERARWNLQGYPALCVLARRPGSGTSASARLTTPTTARNSA
ncbi:MAG TPA: class I SAM-dependent methyltransferase [Solirubrobacteraceae bacterium]|nr:class I SAM-dependent methyltransferase [Solirubrobacteraceae bacterium]